MTTALQIPATETYFQKRMKEIGFDPNTDKAAFNKHPDEPYGVTPNKPLFEEDAMGNIKIYFPTLEGELASYDASQSKSNINYVPFARVRLANPTGDNKYIYEKAGIGVRPYLTMPLISKYQRKEKIETLIITEGEIKAFVGAKHGLDIVAIPGITVWKPREQQGIFYEIEEIIRVCKVQRIILLLDNDAMIIKYDQHKELTKRPQSFSNCVVLFKKLCLDFHADLFLMIGKETLEFKGLDDLLIGLPHQKEKIIGDLIKENGGNEYFNRFNISAASYDKIRGIFGINAGVKGFYAKYIEYIGVNPFKAFGGVYQYNNVDDTFTIIESVESKRYVMIGTTIYKRGIIPGLLGEDNLEEVLFPIDQKTLEHEYQNAGSARQAFYRIPRYDKPINEPSHTSYQQVFNFSMEGISTNLYNIYNKVTWKPTEGEFPNILRFIKHIFSEKELTWNGKTFPQYEMGLDYLKVLWMKPKYFLPILCLVSKERRTGKSTFGDLLQMIFQQNCKDVPVSALSSQFSSYFANSLIMKFEESYMNRKEMVDKLKHYSTARTIALEAKGKDAHQVNSFIKIVILTNDIDNFALVDDDEVRFWVIQVPKLEQKDLDLDLLGKMQKEIPAFLNFLQERPYTVPYSDRMWFPEKLLMTEALANVQRNSKSRSEKDLEAVVTDYFVQAYSAGLINDPVVHLAIGDITKLLDNKVSKGDVRQTLQIKMGKEPTSNSRDYDYYTGGDGVEMIAQRRKNIIYTWYADELMSMSQLVKFLNLKQISFLCKNKPALYHNMKIEILQHLFPKIDSTVLLEYWRQCKTFDELIKLTEKVQQLL